MYPIVYMYFTNRKNIIFPHISVLYDIIDHKKGSDVMKRMLFYILLLLLFTACGTAQNPVGANIVRPPFTTIAKTSERSLISPTLLTLKMTRCCAHFIPARLIFSLKYER